MVRIVSCPLQLSSQQSINRMLDEGALYEESTMAAESTAVVLRAPQHDIHVFSEPVATFINYINSQPMENVDVSFIRKLVIMHIGDDHVRVPFHLTEVFCITCVCVFASSCAAYEQYLAVCRRSGWFCACGHDAG